MAKKKPEVSEHDLFMQNYMRGLHQRAVTAAEIGSASQNLQYDQAAQRIDQADDLFKDAAMGPRSAGEIAKDSLVAVGGTLGSMVNALDVLGSGALELALDGNGSTVAGALERTAATGEYFDSLKSQKTQAFQRVKDHRVAQAAEQRGEEEWYEAVLNNFGNTVSEYADSPDQILSEGIGQLPYILTGGTAKAATAGITGGARAIVNKMVAKGLSREAAEKIAANRMTNISMGLVGAQQGAIEGSGAAADAYMRVMNATDTAFASDQERENAALEAALIAGSMAGVTTAVTGTLASKWELAPFTAKGATAAGRVGDNIFKALQEGVQEVTESGMGEFATNVAGNQVLSAVDQVDLSEGVGEAMGEGFVLGVGGAGITSAPSTAKNTVGAAFGLAGSAIDAMGQGALTKEQTERNQGFDIEAAEVAQGIQNTGAAQTLTAADEAVQNDPVIPDEYKGTVYSAYLKAAHALRDPSKGQTDEQKLKALTTVLKAVDHLALTGAQLQQDIDAETDPVRKAELQTQMDKIENHISEADLAKWLEKFPADQSVAEKLDKAFETPEAYASAVSLITSLNPVHLPKTVIEKALAQKNLEPDVRAQLRFSLDLHEAIERVSVAGTNKSMMETGFPEAGGMSVREMIGKVSEAVKLGATSEAQKHFAKLTAFATDRQQKAVAFQAALDKLLADPSLAKVTVEGYDKKLDPKTGKLVKGESWVSRGAKSGTKASEDLTAQIQQEASAINTMAQAVAQQYGLTNAPQAAPVTPSEAPAAPVEAIPAQNQETAQRPSETRTKAPKTKKAAKQANPDEMTDAQIESELGTLKGNSGPVALRRELLQNEQDRRTAEAMTTPTQTAQEASQQAPESETTESTPPVEETPVEAPVSEAAESEVKESAKAQPEQTTQTVDEAAEAVQEEGLANPRNNHSEGLRSEYPVADNATEAEKEQAKNHLVHSFNSTKEGGLVEQQGDALYTDEALTDFLLLDTKDMTEEEIQQDLAWSKKTAGKVLDLVQNIENTLQDLMWRFPTSLLKGKNPWANNYSRSLYATVTDKKGRLQYQQGIARVMAWTGLQAISEIATPIEWDDTAIDNFSKAYGGKAAQMLAQGWVPMATAVGTVSRLLQTNLGLQADESVSSTYTEGTMSSLASDIVTSLIVGDARGQKNKETGYLHGGDLQMQQLTGTVDGKEVTSTWVRNNLPGNTLVDYFNMMQHLREFFPERTRNVAYSVGTAPTRVNKKYRGSQQNISSQQEKALKKRNQTWHKISPIMYQVFKKLDQGQFLKLFGHVPFDMPEGDVTLTYHQLQQQGQARTHEHDDAVIRGHIEAVERTAKETGLGVSEINSYFEYEMVVSGRAMTKGTSPQSSTKYREIFANVQRQVNPADGPAKNAGFLMAVAQGLGMKMDKQPITVSLEKLAQEVQTERFQKALEAANTLLDQSSTSETIDAALGAINESEYNGSSHGVAALLHYAQYLKGEEFTSTVAYEIDGATDGPINLFMLMGMQKDRTKLTPMLKLAGLFLSTEQKALQDYVGEIESELGAKDLYGVVSNEIQKATASLRNLYTTTAQNAAEVNDYLKASDRLAIKLGMLTTLKDREGTALTGPENLIVARDTIKTPTQAGGYGQSSFASRIAYTKAMLEKVSELMALGQWDAQDQQDLETVAGNRIVYSAKTNRSFLVQKDSRSNEYQVNLRGWNGTPLENWEIVEITDAMSGFHARAFTLGIESALGAQLQNMNVAREAINHVVRFAQTKLQEAYETERQKMVSEGKLLPKQPLPPAVERRVAKEIWDKYVPHPAFRTMAGMPVGRLERTLNVGLDRVSGTLFNQAVYQTNLKDSQNNLTERSLAEPGKSFSASSIIGSGDGAMMTDFFSQSTDNVQDMYDGAYLDPTLIDKIGAEINGGVFRNWNFDFIGKILETIPIQNPEFTEYLKGITVDVKKVNGKEVGVTAYTQVGLALSQLSEQRNTNRENWQWIKGQTSWTSHMAGHNNPHKNDPGTDTAFEGEFAYALTYTTDGVNLSNVEATTPTMENPGAPVVVPVATLDRNGVIEKMQSHTWKNKLALGIWNKLVPLLADDLSIMFFDDAESLTQHFKETTGKDVPLSNGLYYKNQIWSVKKENTIVHEAFHSVFTNMLFDWGMWKNGEVSRPPYLTKRQLAALDSIEKLMHEFQSLTSEDTPPWTSPEALTHAQSMIAGLLGKKDIGGAMDEFLAYTLTDKNLQEVLRTKRTTLGDLVRKVFEAIKTFMGMPDGTQSDTMLAHILSNFQSLADDVQVPPPTMLDMDVVRMQVEPEIGFSFKEVLTALEAAAVNHPNPEVRDPLLTAAITAPDKGRDRIAQMSETGYFNFSPENQAAAEYLQAMFHTGLNLDPGISSVLSKLADQIRDAGPSLWVTANDPTGQERYNYIFERNADSNLSADLLSLALVDEDFNRNLTEAKMDQKLFDKSNMKSMFTSAVDMMYQAFDHKGDIKKGASVADAYKALALRIRKSNLKYAEQMMKRPSFYQKLQDGATGLLSNAGDTLGKLGQKALDNNQKQVGILLTGLAAIGSDTYADALGRATLHLTNQIEGHDFARGLINEMVGTNSSNRKLIRAKMLADHTVSALRQSLVEQVPTEVKSWFKDFNEGTDALLHRGIGETGLYLLSQDNKDRLGEIFDDPSQAILDAQVQLMSHGNSRKRIAMIKHAKALGDRMAGKTAFTPYSNTLAIADLGLDGGTDTMNKADVEALEDLSTLQALSHMTASERRNLKKILEEQPDAFWRSSLLLHSIYNYDLENAGGEGMATLNFRKGYMPVEADTRRKVKIFSKNQLQKAQNQGWTVVGDFDQFHVYMATTTGNPPTLSGGAVQATDYHLGGVHFRSGAAIDNSVSTMITNPREVQKIFDLFTKGKAELPYTVVYDHEGVVVGFQRIMDQEIVNKHTRATKSLSQAAGMHIGRLHEQKMARELNDVAVGILFDTYDDEYKDDPKAFVNVTSEDAPSYAKRVWDTLPHHTKKSFENRFGKGNVMIRKDQLYDALGYHKASITDIFNNTSTFDRDFEDRMAAAFRSVFKGNTYKYLAQAEAAWQGAVGVAKDTIIVKSGTVAAINLASNQTQLAMVTGNPVWNLAAQSRAHKELKMHLDLERRMSRLRAQEMSTADPAKKRSLNLQIEQMRKSQKSLRIAKLVDAGEMPVIAEGISQVDRYNLANDGMAWLEQKVGKLPPAAQKAIDFATISKESPLYQGMNAMVQYGDFVAKAAMYEWLTTKKGMAHEQAITEVNDEFVNYSRLPGRARTYLEDTGLAWFWNYKLRIMKIIARRFRKNPLGFLMFNVGGDIANVDPIWNQVPWVKDWTYSMGPEMMFRAPSMLMWNNLFGALK